MYYKYRISLIVPVYNVELYLESCLNSIINQTMDKSEFEVLLINDGSKDQSLKICQTFAKLSPVFKVISKENEGLSATRNRGLDSAEGKYIAYLDSDDELSPPTLKNLCDFFDAHYEETDCVTYPIHSYRNGVRQKDHFRYKYLTKSGIYDLNNGNNIYITQTNINIVVKGESAKTIQFDTTDDFHQEDQKYVCDIVKAKQTIGFCADAEYRYMRRGESITGSMFNPINLFEATQSYFENMFSEYEEEVPQYFQSMYVHDLQWKTKSNILFPYHYEGEEYDAAIDRIKQLLVRVNEDVIINHPDMDIFHKVFWLSMKPDNRALCIPEENRLNIFSNGKRYYSREKVELVLSYLTVIQDEINIILCAKSPAFSFTNQPKVFAIVNHDDKDDSVEEEQVLFPSADNYYHCRTKTNTFWAFIYKKKLSDHLKSFYFEVECDGIRYKTNYYFMPTAPFNNTYGIYNYIVGNHHIKFDKNVFYFAEISDEEAISIKNESTTKIEKKLKTKLGLRTIAEQTPSSPIWLYYDCKGVEKDNGYYQFINDWEKEDGIERYYINSNSGDLSGLFTEKQLDRVITFGSYTHKALFLQASVIITAFAERENYIPFTSQEEQYYRDLFHYKLVYLQHGILHATLPWKYSPERIGADKIVVSSYFEIENFTNHYHFPLNSLIKTGMPRYEFVNRDKNKLNRILFAPTWRQYLISKDGQGEWAPDPARFMNSDYYKGIQDLISDQRINDILESNDLYVEIKLHPIFAGYTDCFDTSSSRFSCVMDIEDISSYAVFVTDFSSWIFDFVFLQLPIVYFVPDMKEFKCGLNTYRELDIPFEEGFGELTTNTEEFIHALLDVIDNDLKALDKYQNRMDGFFLPMNNIRENIYKDIIETIV